MKKILFLSLLGIACLTTPVMIVSAEEETTTVDETETTTLVENNEAANVDTPETVSYMTQLNDFCNKWLTPILSAISGITSVALGALLFYRKMKKKIEQHEAITDEDLNEAKDLYNEGKELLTSNAELLGKNAEELKLTCAEFKEEANSLVKSYEDMSESQGKKLDHVTAELSTLKELLCNLVASEPSLALNGYAKKIMELCNEMDDEETEAVVETVETVEEGSEGNE